MNEFIILIVFLIGFIAGEFRIAFSARKNLVKYFKTTGRTEGASEWMADSILQNKYME